MYIKGFDSELKCRGFQFEIGGEYRIKHTKPMELCTDTVFHFCDSIQKVNMFYNVCTDNRFCIIEALGEVIKDGEKCGSDHIRIVRELTAEELKTMTGQINGNTGLFNSGHMNSGDRNSGYRNSGDMNSGYRNSGDRNSGDRNSGYRNSGGRNSGYRNSGDRNSGDRNSGDRNSGDRNSGYRNSGDMNSGYRNSGDRNSGYRNSGDMNSGDMNSGVANKCYGSNGVFCNETDMNIRIFNKPSGMSLHDFYNSKYWEAMISEPYNLTVCERYTAEECAGDPEKCRAGGHLVVRTPEEAWAEWWAKLTDENKEIIKQIPNFDPDVFNDITGIEV